MIRLLNVFLAFWSMYTIDTERVLESPRLVEIPRIKQSLVAWPPGTPLVLKCKAQGVEPMQVRWYKNGRPIHQTDSIVQDSRWSLKFRKPQLSDNGLYTCVVANAYGMVKHNYSLRILERIPSAPVLLPGYPESVTAHVGDNVDLECLEKPNGQVSDYRWLKTDSLVNNDPVSSYENGEVPLISSQRYKPFTLEKNGTRLHGVKLQLGYVSEKDGGYYTCFLSNSNGFTHGTAYLNVTPVLSTAPPEFIIPKHERQHFVVSVEGEDITMSCLARGGSPLLYEWSHDGKRLRSDDRHELLDSELVVKHVQRGDEGIYSCKVRNDYGHVKHDIKLKVLALLSRHPSYPVLLAGYPKDTTATMGDSVSLFCADSIRQTIVDYRWLKWEKSVRNFTKADFLDARLFTMLQTKHHAMSASSKGGVYLSLKNLTKEDEGLYTCLASNYVGYSYQSAYLTVNSPVKKHYDPPETVAAPTDIPTSQSVVKRRCFNFDGYSSENKTECETIGLCASIFEKKTNHMKMFCDNDNFCKRNHIDIGGCINVTDDRVLCCCSGERCNVPADKFFQKSGRASKSSRSHLWPIIFFVALALAISAVLALLGYRIRQRKAALHDTVTHETRRSQKTTKKVIMETKWLKEDV